jgi:hypothetical protein
MSKAEKENRVNSLAVTFLEQQQIIPHPLAGQIIRGYKEGYHQAEKDLHKSIYKAGFLDGFEDAVEGQYEKGYKQAEKDLELLTLEDIRIILDVENDILRECNNQKELVIKTYPKGEDYYGEILKRFKERKEK